MNRINVELLAKAYNNEAVLKRGAPEIPIIIWKAIVKEYNYLVDLEEKIPCPLCPHRMFLHDEDGHCDGWGCH